MTEKLYYTSTKISEFDSTVLSCEKTKDGYALLLAKTAFFPEGGGMVSDVGTIGGVLVKNVYEKDGCVFHSVDTAFGVGKTVHGVIDMKVRKRRIQNHSGEHIISGITHKLFSAENTGFHADEDIITVDFDVKLTKEDVQKIEIYANLAIYENHSVKTYFPTKTEAENISYRAKHEISENLRIVEIEDVDICACCALHVERTGEIGIIRIYDSFPHRGGTRLIASCGISALEEVIAVSDCNDRVASMLSAKKLETPSSVQKMLSDIQFKNREIYSLRCAIADEKLKAFEGKNDFILVTDEQSAEVNRYTALKGAQLHKVFAVISDSRAGLKYTISSESVDLRSLSKDLNVQLCAKGGGSADLIQGNISSDLLHSIDVIKDYFS